MIGRPPPPAAPKLGSGIEPAVPLQSGWSGYCLQGCEAGVHDAMRPQYSGQASTSARPRSPSRPSRANVRKPTYHVSRAELRHRASYRIVVISQISDRRPRRSPEARRWDGCEYAWSRPTWNCESRGGLDAERVVRGTLRPAASSGHSPVEDVGPLAMPKLPLTANPGDLCSGSAAVLLCPRSRWIR
jgi:hypothetical protein